MTWQIVFNSGIWAGQESLQSIGPYSGWCFGRPQPKGRWSFGHPTMYKTVRMSTKTFPIYHFQFWWRNSLRTKKHRLGVLGAVPHETSELHYFALGLSQKYYGITVCLKNLWNSASWNGKVGNVSKITQKSLDLEVERLNHLEIWLTFAWLKGIFVWLTSLRPAFQRCQHFLKSSQLKSSVWKTQHVDFWSA